MNNQNDKLYCVDCGIAFSKSECCPYCGGEDLIEYNEDEEMCNYDNWRNAWEYE